MNERRVYSKGTVANIRAVCLSGKHSDTIFFTDLQAGEESFILRVSWWNEKGAMVAEVVTDHTPSGSGITLRMSPEAAQAGITLIKERLGVKHVVGIIDTDYVPINERPPFAPVDAKEKPTR